MLIMSADNAVAQAVVGNSDVYVSEDVYFRLLQDKGQILSDKERDRLVNGKNKHRAAVKGKIFFGGLLYPSLYKLAEEVYKKMGDHDDLFPRLPNSKNKTKAIHVIGKIIAKKRIEVNRSDIHSRPQGEVPLELFNSDEFAAFDRLFVLPQRDVISVCHSNYGKVAESRRPTTDDKVRALGICMTNEDIRELVPDMLGKTKGGTRAELDAAASKSRRGFHLLHAKFVDSEVVVTLPAQWDDPATARKVDERLGAGIFEEHAQFDPNNDSRIKLPWLVKEVQAIFKLVAKEYQVMMDKYMMGTGGGDGDEANFSNWWERDDTRTVTYINGQNSNLYLSLIYMWDKMFNFVFVEKKDPLPAHMGIGDIYDGEIYINSNGDEEELRGGSFNDGNIQSDMSTTTPRRSPVSGKSGNDGDLAELMKAMRDVASARSSSNETQKEILKLLTKNDREVTEQAQLDRGAMMNGIEQTQRVIKNFELDLDKHKAKKQKLENVGANNDKIEKLDKEIKSTKNMIKISRAELIRQMEEMGSALKGVDDLSDEDDSD